MSLLIPTENRLTVNVSRPAHFDLGMDRLASRQEIHDIDEPLSHVEHEDHATSGASTAGERAVRGLAGADLGDWAAGLQVPGI